MSSHSSAMAMLRGLDQRLTLRQLRAVAAIAEAGSLLGAAQAIGVSQPALTRTLSDLETLFRVTLFERHARGTSPTEFGVALVETARRILTEVAELETRFSSIALRGGSELRVGTLPSAGAGLMPGTLVKLTETMPSLDIQLVQGRLHELLPSLRTGSIEMLIGRLYPTNDDEEFSRCVLYDEPFSLLVRAGHPLMDCAMAPSIDALRRFRFILPTDNQRMAGEIEAWFADFGMTPDQTLRTNASATMRELLLAGDDILPLPALMVAGDIIRGTIQVLKVPISPLARPGGLLLRRGVPLSEAARSLLKVLRTQIRVLAEAGFVAIR